MNAVIETAERYPHLIFRAEDGLPVIERAGFKAIHLISNHVAHGWSAEELVVNFPQLRLGEVYSVLAWFADHWDAVMAVLEKSAAGARALSLEARHQQLAVRLRETMMGADHHDSDRPDGPRHDSPGAKRGTSGALRPTI